MPTSLTIFHSAPANSASENSTSANSASTDGTPSNSRLEVIQPLTKTTEKPLELDTTPPTMREYVSNTFDAYKNAAPKIYNHAMSHKKQSLQSLWKGTAIGAFTGLCLGGIGGAIVGALLGGLANIAINTVSSFKKQQKLALLESASIPKAQINSFKKTTLFHTQYKKRVDLSGLSAFDLEGGAQKIAIIMLNAKNNSNQDTHKEAHQKVRTLDLSNSQAVNDQFIVELLSHAIPPSDSSARHGLDGIEINVKNTAINNTKRLKEALKAQQGIGNPAVTLENGQATIKFTTDKKESITVTLNVSQTTTGLTSAEAATATATAKEPATATATAEERIEV